MRYGVLTLLKCSSLASGIRFIHIFLCMVLDIFSKYGWSIPLQDKKGETVEEAFQSIFKEGRKPKYLWVGKGKEYYNKYVKELINKHSIQMYSTEYEEELSDCKRWNITKMTKMLKEFSVQGSTQYLDMTCYLNW